LFSTAIRSEVDTASPKKAVDTASQAPKPADRARKAGFPNWNFRPRLRVVDPYRRSWLMLVERGLRVLNVEAVGDAYAIAMNYLRKSGAISDTVATNDALLEIIVEMYHRGEYNRIRLANKAIAKFEALELV
jgi:hypothetical protein